MGIINKMNHTAVTQPLKQLVRFMNTFSSARICRDRRYLHKKQNWNLSLQFLFKNVGPVACLGHIHNFITIFLISNSSFTLHSRGYSLSAGFNLCSIRSWIMNLTNSTITAIPSCLFSYSFWFLRFLCYICQLLTFINYKKPSPFNGTIIVLTSLCVIW